MEVVSAHVANLPKLLKNELHLLAIRKETHVPQAFAQHGIHGYAKQLRDERIGLGDMTTVAIKDQDHIFGGLKQAAIALFGVKKFLAGLLSFGNVTYGGK